MSRSTRRTRCSTTSRTRKSRISTTRSDGPVALGLGANLGDARATLGHTVALLREVLSGLEVAPLYVTVPRSPIPQPDFLNTAVVGRSRLAPAELLAWCRSLEALAGRVPAPPLSPRTLDIDLLLFGDLVVASDDLVLPHPRLRERRFVLAPLADLAPAWALPPDGSTVAELLAAVGQVDEVRQVPW